MALLTLIVLPWSDSANHSEGIHIQSDCVFDPKVNTKVAYDE